MYGDGQDGVDVPQHCFEMLWVLLEAQLCQNQRLADVWKWKRRGARLESGEGWGSGATCWRTCKLLTVLRGHSDGLAVAESPPAPARRVHFVLHAAVDDPKLYLRRRRTVLRNGETQSGVSAWFDSFTIHA